MKTVLRVEGFRLNRTKTKYIKYNFSTIKYEKDKIYLNRQMIPQKNTFQYLKSILQKDNKIDKNISHRIKIG
uniref:Uncharacterized protein n=1 Tax=Arundo donax TaxID=35708 RepID=A0A0A9DEF5_ARUDO